eukprot:TRINITY_DN3329_c0_g2_i1.p1 TRINITY_DN3329_c0_g2~~TRINITY_DN3329_c0_g2_i1.p1  ORF type:complete len:531 (+),score=56.59 TRINITY_DN3329_c0_g2_i1:43-1635(+)
MSIELREIKNSEKTSNSRKNVARKIAANFLRAKEEKESKEIKQLYKSLFWYGCLFLVIVISGFLIGWFSSLFHHSERPESGPEEQIPPPLDTGLVCQSGDVERGHTCAHIRTCKNGEFVESICPRFKQFDSVTKSCTWIHLATCEDGSDGHVSTGVIQDETTIEDEDSFPVDTQAPDLQRVLDTEARLIMKHGLQRVRRSVSTLANTEVDKISPNRQENPPNVRVVESLVTARDWSLMFPLRNNIYTYRSFLQAVGKFPGFCETENICKLSLAVIFAHFTQETGAHDGSLGYPEWRQGLYYLEEAGCESTDCGYSSNCAQKTWLTETWPCEKSSAGRYNSYHGRGAKQISYNYNYGLFSTYMYGDASTLLKSPDLVAKTWLSLASAIWFFLMPQPPKPSMLEVLDGTWIPNGNDATANLNTGFGVTTNIINGGVECGKGSELPQSQNRQLYFRRFYSELKIEDRKWLQNLGCSDMKEFPSNGGGAQAIYWEQDWARRYHCKLVSYATPFSALVPGDYKRCVEAKFKISIK